MISLLLCTLLIQQPQAKPTLEQAAALAAKVKRPLVVWVNCNAPLVRAAMPECVHVHVEAWKTSAEPGVVACIIHQNWPHGRALIPESEVTLERIREEMKALAKELAPQVVPIIQRQLPTTFSGRSC